MILCSVKYRRDQQIITQFGQRLKQLRKARSMSQEELAYACELDLSQIGRIERGRTNTSLTMIAVLATALQVEPKDLLNFSESIEQLDDNN